MAQVARIIGGPGTGKTTELLRIMDLVLESQAADPYTIGFVSFTRAARREAAVRAADRFGLKPEDLERNGWFRTLHAICYRQLEAGKELLTGNAESVGWLRDNLGEEIGGAVQRDEDTDLTDGPGEQATEADQALAIWEKARNTLRPVEEVRQEFATFGANIPTPERCREVIERYERMKRIDHRSDFTDLLSRFAGIRFSVDGFEDVMPEGEVPNVPVWLLDEQQDTSALLDRVCRRLVEPARFAYLCLDPFQAIYGFAGSDSRHAMSWEIQAGKQRILDTSHRCPSRILSLGETVLRRCSDYWDRGIRPRSDGGEIDQGEMGSWWDKELNPAESWLLIARTNFQAKRLAKRLKDQGIPWVPTRGNGGWRPCAKTRAQNALYTLSQGQPIEAAEWRDVVKTLPSKVGEREFLTRGTKTAWSKREGNWSELANLETIGGWGATGELAEYVQSGRWKNLISGSAEYVAALERWGHQAVSDPQIRVGTVHSVKGSEADNVMLLTTTSLRVGESAAESQRAQDEEHRVSYVAVTRARKRLVLLDELAPYRMEIVA